MKTMVTKETTLTVNKKNGSYGMRRGNIFFTKDDVNYYDRIFLIRGKGITPECEQKIKEKWKHKEIIFLSNTLS